MLYNVDFDTIVGVIAALSPRNKWERNMQDAESMIKLYSSGADYEDLMDLKVCTFSTGKAKAATLLVDNITDSSKIREILKGPKLIEFFNCISDDVEDVCIDGHAYSVWFGERITLQNVPSIGKKLRATIKADYIKAAKEAGIKASVIQAVTWVAWKRIHGV